MSWTRNFGTRASARPVVALLCGAFLVLGSGCAVRAVRGGEGTANPDLDRPAMSVTLDRDDITYLVADYLERLVTWRRVFCDGQVE